MLQQLSVLEAGLGGLVGGAVEEDDWKIEVVLRREAEMAERWNRLKRKMQVGAAAPPLPPPA